MNNPIAWVVSAVLLFTGCEKSGGGEAGLPPTPPTTQAPAAPKGTGLKAEWTPQAGDIAGERIVGALRLRGDLDAPMTAKWDREKGQIVVTIGGARSKVEESKETLEKMRSVILRDVKPALARELGYELAETDLVLVYVNRNTGKEVVRFTNNAYLVP